MKTHKTKMSSNGQIVIPAKIREEAAVTPGDHFSVALLGQNIVLTPCGAYPAQEADASSEDTDDTTTDESGQ